MRYAVLTALLMTAACAGCGGDDGGTSDARPDATVDAMVDAPAGCTGPQPFTGELIDFDSTAGNFMGVFDAVFTVRGEPACSVTTAPNGRWIMSLPAADAVVDVTGPGDYIDGLVDIQRSVIMMGTDFSFRALTAARAVTLNEALGQTYDPALAQVLIYQSVDLDVFTLSGSNGMTVGTDDGTTWAPGDQFRYLLFTNVELGAGTQDLIAASGATIGDGPVRVEAGKITYVSTRFVLD